jgi:hypothetical protein
MNVRSRVSFSNHVIFEQADFFQQDGFTRVTGLTISDISVQVFQDNQLLNWTLAEGQYVDDDATRSGYVYWSEITGAPGVYSVRFRPTSVGFWRMIITYADGLQLLAQDVEVIFETTNSTAVLGTPRFL